MGLAALRSCDGVGFRPAGPPGFQEQGCCYLPEGDVSLCPAGARLARRGAASAQEVGHYQASGESCRGCEHFEVCTTSVPGRSLTRVTLCEEGELCRQRVRSAEGKRLPDRRRQRAEGPWSCAKLYGGLARMAPPFSARSGPSSLPDIARSGTDPHRRCRRIGSAPKPQSRPEGPLSQGC